MQTDVTARVPEAMSADHRCKRVFRGRPMSGSAEGAEKSRSASKQSVSITVANGFFRSRTDQDMSESISRWRSLREILRYVPRFRDRLFVIALDGEVVEAENFRNL